jgi:surface protein
MDKNFEIIRELGKGAFGSVYLIKINNKYYALKKIRVREMKKEERDKCIEEANILSSLNSEYIVKFYNSYIEKDNFNIIMEYAGDVNLKTFIKKHKYINKLIDENLIKNIIIQICLGLKEIHSANIIHRDLTPENIFIDETNHKIKIGDFGVSKFLEENIKYADSIVGKYKYFAPEIIKNQKYDNKIDIYALGCIIYELFTLNEYFIDKNYGENNNLTINMQEYDKKWQNLIDLLLKNDYHERPNIEEICKIIKSMKNEILLTININKNDIGQIIYFFDNTNIVSPEIFINDVKYDKKAYFIPEKEGIYNIKLKFNYHFYNCKRLFTNCYKIENIDLSSFDIEKVTTTQLMFNECENLKYVKFSKFFSFYNSENLTNMSFMFYRCRNLKDLDLSSFNTKNVTTMREMFGGCSELENINISSFNTKNVENMSGMFSDCIKLKNLNLLSFNTENVTNMSGLFANCNSLKNLDLSSFNTRNVNYMFCMFLGCKLLDNINLSFFNTSNVTDMASMFKECHSLQSLDLSSFDTKNVTSISHMFNECLNLKVLNLSSFDTKNTTAMKYVFRKCENLENINLSNFNTSNVHIMEGMFDKCYKLKNIDLSSFDTKNTTGMQYMFRKCHNLKNINLSSFDIGSDTELADIFDECNNLEEIYVNKSSFEILKVEFHDLIDKFKIVVK